MAVVWFCFGNKFVKQHLKYIVNTVEYHYNLFGSYIFHDNKSKNIDYYVIYHNLDEQMKRKLIAIMERLFVQTIDLNTIYMDNLIIEKDEMKFYKNLKHKLVCSFLNMIPSMTFLDLDVKYIASLESIIESRNNMFMVDKFRHEVRDEKMINIYLLMREFPCLGQDIVTSVDILPCTMVCYRDNDKVLKGNYECIQDVNWMHLKLDWATKKKYHNTLNGYIVFWDHKNKNSVECQVQEEISFKNVYKNFMR